MFLAEPIELDTQNLGNPLVRWIDAALSRLNQFIPAYPPDIPIKEKYRKRGLAMTQDQQSEPPSVLRPPLFMVGQDTRGNWVVQDQKGIRGGLFVNREAALRYVRSENGFKPQAVVMVSGGIERDMNRNASALLHVKSASDLANRRRIA